MANAMRSPRAGDAAVVTAVGLLAALIRPLPARAQTYTVLHSFTGGPDGANPQASVIRDQAGNLYSTATFGGNRSNCSGAGCGVIFKLVRAGSETVLYTFGTHGPDGAYPSAGVIRDAAGNFLGTGGSGGAYNRGVIFKLDKTGDETVLHSFTARQSRNQMVVTFPLLLG